jgi:hypothetical protein
VIEAVGEFEPTLRSAEDWDYWLRVAAGWEFALVPQPQIYYRQSGGAMSAKVEVMETAQLEVLDRAIRRNPESLRPYRNQVAAKIYQYSAQLYLRHGRGPQTRKLVYQKLWKAFATDPYLLRDRQTHKLLIKTMIVTFLPWLTAKQMLRNFSERKAHSIS